jgi:hypothetical protein
VQTASYAGPDGLGITESYQYSAGRDISVKDLAVGSSASISASYSYDGEGRVTSVQYPHTGSPAAVYSYAYDNMGRLTTMLDQNNNQLVSGVTYNAANQWLSISGTVLNETRTYNANAQVISLVSGSYQYKYNYSATQNNGRVQSMQDVASGETAVYQYDSLNRLVSAAGTGDPQGNWSQTFSYDGFGNLVQKAGSNAPNVTNWRVNPATNQLTSNGATLYTSSAMPAVARAGSALTGTIGSYISENPATAALAQLGGSTIYLNAAHINPSDYYGDLSTVLHEVLHNVTSLTDQDIQRLFGLPQAQVTANITQKLLKDCF